MAMSSPRGGGGWSGTRRRPPRRAEGAGKLRPTVQARSIRDGLFRLAKHRSSTVPPGRDVSPPVHLQEHVGPRRGRLLAVLNQGGVTPAAARCHPDRA